MASELSMLLLLGATVHPVPVIDEMMRNLTAIVFAILSLLALARYALHEVGSFVKWFRKWRRDVWPR